MGRMKLKFEGLERISNLFQSKQHDMLEGDLIYKNLVEFCGFSLSFLSDLPQKTKHLVDKHPLALLSYAFVFFLVVCLLAFCKITVSCIQKGREQKKDQSGLDREKEANELDKCIEDLITKIPEDLRSRMSRKMTRSNLENLKNYQNLMWSSSSHPFYSDSEQKEINERANEFLYTVQNTWNQSAFTICLETEIIAQLSHFISPNSPSSGVITGSTREARMMAIINARESLMDEDQREFCLLLLKGAHSDFYTLGEILNVKVIEVDALEESKEPKLKDPRSLLVVPCSSSLDGTFYDLSLLKGVSARIHYDVSSDGLFFNASLETGLEKFSQDQLISFANKGVASMSLDLAETGLVPRGIGFVLFKDHEEMHHSIYTTLDFNFETERCSNRLSESINPAVLMATWLSLAKFGPSLKDYSKILKKNCEAVKTALKKSKYVKVVGDPPLGRIVIQGNESSLNMALLEEVLAESQFAAKSDPKMESLDLSVFDLGGKKIDQLIKLIQSKAPLCQMKGALILQEKFSCEGIVREAFIGVRNIDLIFKMPKDSE